VIGPKGVKERLEPTGPVVGMLPTAEYDINKTVLEPGDVLLGYTDGVTEATKDGQLFGERRLIEAVEQLRGRPVQTVAEGVRDAATAYAGQLRDDLEVIALRLK